METAASPPAPVPFELLPEPTRIKVLLDILPVSELRNLYLIFAERARDLATRLAEDPPRLNHQDLELCVHDVKGTAANLGLSRLADQAEAVLRTLRSEGLGPGLRRSAELIPTLRGTSTALAGEHLSALLGP